MSIADKLRREGKKEEALEAAINFLEQKLEDDLSPKLKEKLEDASYETLKELQDVIFELDDEDEVLEFLEGS